MLFETLLLATALLAYGYVEIKDRNYSPRSLEEFHT